MTHPMPSLRFVRVCEKHKRPINIKLEILAKKILPCFWQSIRTGRQGERENSETKVNKSSQDVEINFGILLPVYPRPPRGQGGKLPSGFKVLILWSHNTQCFKVLGDAMGRFASCPALGGLDGRCASRCVALGVQLLPTVTVCN